MDRREMTTRSPGRGKGIRAWLVTWEWAGEHARKDQVVQAVLPWQSGAQKIRWFVEHLYANHGYEPAEMVQAVALKHNPYRAEFLAIANPLGDGYIPYEGEILCGHNPWLRARIVTGLRVDEYGELSWAERPLPGTDATK